MYQSIKKTEFQEIKPLFSQSGGVTQKYSRIKELYKENDEYLMFCEPIILSENEIDWKNTIGGEAKSYDTLSKKEKDFVRAKLKTQYNSLYLKAKDEKTKKYLDNFLQIPSTADIFLVDERVVITNWGFIKNSFNAKKNIIKDLIKGSFVKIKIIDSNNKPLSNLQTNLTYNGVTKKEVTNQEGKIILSDVMFESFLTIDIDLSKEESFVETSIQKEYEIDKNEMEIVIQIEKKITPPPPPCETFFCRYKYKLLFLFFILLLLLLLLLFLKKDIEVVVYDKTNNQPINQFKKNIEVFLEPSFIEVKVVDKDTNKAISNAKVIQASNSPLLTDFEGKVKVNMKNYKKGSSIEFKAKAVGYYYDNESKKSISFPDKILTIHLKPIKELQDKKGKMGDPRVNITWYNQSYNLQDIDLHIYDPCGNLIFYNNKNGICGSLNGKLDYDKIEDCIGNCQENTTWEMGGKSGRYKIKVLKYSGNSNPTTIKITIVNNGQVIKDTFTLRGVKSYWEKEIMH